MSIFNMPVYKALGNRLEWLTQNQSLITQNITNADTPSYTAKQLKEPSFKDLLKGSSSQRNTISPTSKGHIPIQSSVLRTYREEQDKEGQTLNDNSVSVEDQILKLNQTAMMDQEMKAILRKNLELMKIALRVR